VVGERKRSLGDIAPLAESIKELGLLNPLTILPDGSLVAGYHRLEACRSLGWVEVDVHVTSLDTLSAELAEIDENLIRNELHWFDRDKQLARRKEIYEDLHPETAIPGRGKNQYTPTEIISVGIPTFASDTAVKTGITDRTIRSSIQRAVAFTEDQGEVLKTAAISQTEATKIARLPELDRVAVIEALKPVNRDGVPVAVPHILSKNNEWYTPTRYVEAARELMGGIDVDPASCEEADKVVRAGSYYDINMDGLTLDWHGRVWLNPPYGRTNGESNQEIWTRKLIDQYERGITTEAVLLVNAAVDTKWFQNLFSYLQREPHFAPVCLPDHRVNFTTPEPSTSGSTHGSAFVYFGPQTKRFFTLFCSFGLVLRRVVFDEMEEQ
jgi:ParB family transcriptional regulator, chromosome partitioning protein